MAKNKLIITPKEALQNVTFSEEFYTWIEEDNAKLSRGDYELKAPPANIREAAFALRMITKFLF